MARRDAARLWASRPWNTDTGRLVWWLRQHRKTGSYTSRRAVRCFWQIALRDAGEVATRAAVKAAGLTLPAWLLDEMPGVAGGPPGRADEADAA